MTSFLHQGGKNWQNEVNKLRRMGASMPYSPTQARSEAMAMQEAVNNRSLIASMNRSRMANYRGRQFTAFQGSNMQIALPKVRQPLGSLADKGIPFNVEDEDELKDIRRWSRLFYATHDLVPLLIDIYSKFPVVGLEFSSKDPLIQKFYEDMFLGELNYLEFLPDQLGREYFTCITPGTPVMTDSGHKPIEKVAVGDLVLTHTGRLRPVTRVTTTPVDEDVVSVRPRFGQPVTMTRDHRVLVNRDGVKVWVQAHEIRDQKNHRRADKVFVPIMDTPGVSTINLWNHLDRDHWRSFSDVLADPPNKDSGVRGNTARGVRKKMGDGNFCPDDIFSAAGHKSQYAPVRHDFHVTDEFLWFLGVVVGDGNCTPGKGTVKIVFNRHENGFAERATKAWKEITGRDAVVKRKGNEIHVMCYDTVWAHVLRDMTYRSNKTRKLPGWFSELSPHQAEILYQGLSDSDGYAHERGSCFTQSDRLLIEDVALLVRKFGVTPRVYNLGNHPDSFSKKDQYVIRHGSHPAYTEEDELGYWVTVWKVEPAHYAGDVYDLTVEEDHSFVTSGFAVHNCGEVTSLAHFNESLGVWSSEEILNPDMLRVSRSLFVQRDRVQLLVKEMVENLRQGPDGGGGMGKTAETPSERLQRNREYEDLVRHYPEIIEAAAQDDGLDISDALISRIVNRSTPWAKRGTPHLLRSFRTLMTEESLMAAQDAVADRLYSPLVLATLGIEDMGDGEPWIPDQGELDDARDDLQAALAADFRLMVHNFGLKVENVFGRESVPNLDSDFDRVQAKLLQAWGIGEALISGGTGGAYASSALNREFVTQIMTGFQNALKRHIIKRAEVIAEAQGHYDYELKGGVRTPIYREIVETDPETGEEYIRRVPKLLIPDVKFSVLNLRDEAQERAFISQLKAMGVPVSDKTLAVNIDMEFDQELERQAAESVSKLMATAQAMKKVQDLCDAQNLPYPPELAQHLMSTLQLRQGKTQTELGEAQAVAGEAQAELQADQIEMQKAMMEQQMAGAGMAPPGAAPPGYQPPADPPPPEQALMEAEVGGDLQAPAQGPNVSPLSSPGPGAPGPGNPPAGVYASLNRINGPHASPPAGSPPSGGVGPELPPGVPEPTEIPRNRQRPVESDSMRSNTPKQVGAGKFSAGPSSWGKSLTASEDQVENQVRRLETVASWEFVPARHPKVSELVNDPKFYRALNMQTYQGQLQADWPEILAGGATESRKILDDMLAQFYEIFGVEPEW